MSEIAPLPPFVLDLFPPCEKGLLKRLAEDTSPAMLREIAMCDYGDGADENLSILTDIQATLILPSRLDWYPMEVLKLTQWFEPSKSTNDSQLVAKSGHLKRAFSCAILLMAGGDPANFDYMMGENDTLAQALVSCFFLGDLYA